MCLINVRIVLSTNFPQVWSSSTLSHSIAGVWLRCIVLILEFRHCLLRQTPFRYRILLRLLSSWSGLLYGSVVVVGEGVVEFGRFVGEVTAGGGFVDVVWAEDVLVDGFGF